MNTMDIYELQEYAKDHGFNTGHFLCNCEKGLFEFKWLDAYLGFIQSVQPEMDGFLSIKTMIELFGYQQKYIPTIGYMEG